MIALINLGRVVTGWSKLLTTKFALNFGGLDGAMEDGAVSKRQQFGG